MLYEIMAECRNFFFIRGAEKRGTFEIVYGQIDLPDMKDGQYYFISGSVFNDGVHKYGEGEPLDDETFTGVIRPMAVPKAFLNLVDRITQWKTDYGDMSPIVSEHFGDYSYQKTVGSTGKQLTWKDAFATELAIWRRLG